MTALHESESMTPHSPPAPTEVDEIGETFAALLRGPTGDGSVKRHAGVKPFWKVDPSHADAAMRHIQRWQAGERVDPDSGCHPLQHAAWRLLAVAVQEITADTEAVAS
jgi:hypothetical protein